MKYFIGNLLIGIAAQLALKTWIPYNIFNWEWWITVLPLSVIYLNIVRILLYK